jgi:hypothetical protein
LSRDPSEADLSAETSPFALSAVDVRASQVELRTYVEALAERLERALPDRVTIERRREGLFKKGVQVAKISFEGNKARYELSLGRQGVVATKAKIVRGVSLSSSQVPPQEWIAELGAEVHAIAAETGAANDALLDFL